MFENLIEILKANPRKIVFTEGPDARILEAADRLKKGGFLTPILVGNVDEVKANAKKGGFDIEGLEILDPATYAGMDEMVEKMVELAEGGLDYSGKCFICQSECEDDAREVARRVEETFPKLDGHVEIFPIGATIGVHTGPGTVALFFWGQKRA